MEYYAAIRRKEFALPSPEAGRTSLITGWGDEPARGSAPVRAKSKPSELASGVPAGMQELTGRARAPGRCQLWLLGGWHGWGPQREMGDVLDVVLCYSSGWFH